MGTTGSIMKSQLRFTRAERLASGGTFRNLASRVRLRVWRSGHEVCKLKLSIHPECVAIEIFVPYLGAPIAGVDEVLWGSSRQSRVSSLGERMKFK